MNRCLICNRIVIFGGSRDGDRRYCGRYCRMRGAELEGRELTAKEQRLRFVSATSRCWVCGSTIYHGSGIFDGDRQYCSRACCKRAAELRTKYFQSVKPREKLVVPAEFQAAVFQFLAYQRRFSKAFLIIPALSLLWVLLIWIEGMASVSRAIVWMLIFLVSLLAACVVMTVTKIERKQKELGLQCPQCKLLFRGIHLSHVLSTGKCMKCGATIFPT